MEASSDGPFSRRRAEQRDLHSSFQILLFNLGIASREQATDAGIEQGYSGYSASTDQVGQSTWERSLDAWTELELGPQTPLDVFGERVRSLGAREQQLSQGQ